jgi:hypothetical protein
LTDSDVKRPVTNGEHDKNYFYNLDERVGHISVVFGYYNGFGFLTVMNLPG